MMTSDKSSNRNSIIVYPTQTTHTLYNDGILPQTNHIGIAMSKSCLLSLICLLGCAKKPTPAVPSTPEPTPILSDSEDCPEGVKIGCNVPDVTQADLDGNQQLIVTCTETCVQSRQAESISADQIENECHNQCMEEHFMGQVEVIPEIIFPEE